MPPNNNVAQLTQDFLKRKGIQSDFNVRTDIFNRFGLNNELGEFKGSRVQNDAILNQLQNAEKSVGVNINANNINDIISTQQLTEQTAFTQAGITAEPGSAEATQEILARGQALTPTPPTQPSAQAPTPTQAPAIPPPEDITPVSAAGLLPEIPTPQDLATQALETVTGAATFPLQQEAQEAKKAAVTLGAQRETEAFISNIASRGLFFSGKKAEGVSTIEADKLSELLNIDRSFALLMVEGLQTAAQNIAKEAQKGRQEAIDSLEALGFVISPITGQIEPTLQARKVVAGEERAIRTEERQESQFQLSIAKAQEQQRQFDIREERLTSQLQASQELNAAKFDLSIAKSVEAINQANERIRISEENLVIAQAREARLSKAALDSNTYTDTQLGKLRAFGVDVADTELADTLLFKGEAEHKKLLEVREKSGIGLLSSETLAQLPDVFFGAWNNVKSFFGL